MSENSPEPNRSYWARIAIGAVLPALYVLSVGPVGLLIQRGDLPASSPVVRMIYAPLGLAMQHSELIRDLVFGYLSLWGVRIS